MLIMIFVILLLILNMGLSRQMTLKKDYLIQDTITTLIIGNSHAAYSYNDSLIRNTRSFAQSGETYFYSFVKIRTLLQYNKHLKQIYLEVTNRNFEPMMTEWTFGNRFIKDRLPKYGQFMTPAEKWTLLKGNPVTYIETQPVVTRHQLESLNGRNKPLYTMLDWGGYEYHPENKVDSFILLQNKKPPVTELPLSQYSRINMRYLDSIVSLCKLNGLKLRFLRTPMHKAYKCSISDSAFGAFIQRKYPAIPFTDLSITEIPDSDFADLEHLNYNGSKKISLILDSIIHNTSIYLPVTRGK